MTRTSLFNRNSTDILRGICMLMIVAHHAYFDMRGFDNVWTPGIFHKFGYLGTGVFFFLSGYGMFLSLKRNSPIRWQYIKRKLIKLFLPFFGLWILYLIVSPLIGTRLSVDLLPQFMMLGKPASEGWFFKVIVGAYLCMFLIWKTDLSDKFKIIILTLFSIGYVVFAFTLLGGGKSYWLQYNIKFAFRNDCGFFKTIV